MILGSHPQMPFSYAILPESLPLGKLKAYIMECFRHFLKYKYHHVILTAMFIHVSDHSSQDMKFRLEY